MFRFLDWNLFLPAAFLVAIGSVVLTSVSPLSYPLHFAYLTLALLVFLTLANIEFSVYKALAPTLYIISLIFLLVTLLFGSFTRGAVRWIEIGSPLGNLTLQTSEIVKPLVVLFLALVVSQGTSHRRYFLAALVASLPFVLVFIQPDLGSALVIFAGFLGVMFFSGLPWKAIFTSVAGLGIFLPLLWRSLAHYQQERILTFIEPGKDPLGAGYNSIQALIAIGSGGLTGRGLGQGTQSQLLFLPERHTDFIFASIGEELGLMGAGLVILLFTLLFARVIALFLQANKTLERSFIGGIFFMLFAQAAINIGMNLGLLPITGIPLPFVSSGGSALLGVSATLGILSSLGRSHIQVN